MRQVSYSPDATGVTLSKTIAIFALALAAALMVGGCAPSTDAGHTSSLATAPATRSTATIPVIAASPAATPSSPVEARLDTLARQAIGGLARQVEVVYDASKATATVTAIVTGNIPDTDAKIAAAHELVKRICYQAFPALQASGVPLREMTIIVLGPMQDEYANLINDWYGVAVISASTAAHIPWSSVSADTAWEKYDQGNLRVSFVVAD